VAAAQLLPSKLAPGTLCSFEITVFYLFLFSKKNSLLVVLLKEYPRKFMNY